MAVDLSVLVPVWNNEKEIPRAYERVVEVGSRLARSLEIVFVDDGSTDKTFSVLEELHRVDPRVSVLKLKRNYGQHPALAAAIDHARGRFLVTLDVDLQGDPAEIPRFLEKIEEGYDLVSGWRIGRKAPFLRRRLPSFLVNRLIGVVTGIRLHDYGCGMNALTRDLGLQLKNYGEQRRFLKPLAATLASRTAEVQIVDRPGQQKASRYSLFRLFGVMLDFITSFSTRPFRLVSFSGFLLAMLGGLGAMAYVAARVALDVPPSDRFQVLALLFLLFGLQFLIVGLMGEFVVRIYHLQQQRPLYNIERQLGASD